MPRVENGRRPAGYYFRARARANEHQLSMLSDEQLVAAYARTDHMGFAIPYTFAGAGHNFFPDFLVRLANGATLVLEVKGYEDEQDRAKYAAATRWCEAVSNWGQMGRWLFDHCGGPGSVKAVLARYSS
jgi:type III restriction enzyme